MKTVILLLILNLLSFSKAQEILIGAYYFPGWEKKDWHWKVYKDIKNFKNREPINGWKDLDSVDFMRKEISWAFDHGIDFFAFDWYWNFYKKKEEMDYAIKNFILVNKSMKFSILWANHGKLSKSLKDYELIINVWQRYVDNKYYLKFNGKPIIFIFSYENLINYLGKSKVKLLINTIKTKLNAFIVAVYNGPYNLKNQNFISSIGFDAISGWNYLYLLKRKYNIKVYSYMTYISMVEKIYNQIYDSSVIPIFPSVLVGWNDVPWRKKPSYILVDNNPEYFSTLLKEAYCVVKYSTFYPKIIMIESWNEFGEGSYLIPTKKFQYKFLEKIKYIKEDFKCE